MWAAQSPGAVYIWDITRVAAVTAGCRQQVPKCHSSGVVGCLIEDTELQMVLKLCWLAPRVLLSPLKLRSGRGMPTLLQVNDFVEHGGIPAYSLPA